MGASFRANSVQSQKINTHVQKFYQLFSCSHQPRSRRQILLTSPAPPPIIEGWRYRFCTGEPPMAARLLSCPECGVTLKVPAAFADERTIECPKCATVIAQQTMPPE